MFHAIRPLQMNELREAISVRDGDKELHEEFLLHPDELESVCEGLLVYEKSSEIVQFAHFSVQEFLGDCYTKDLLSCIDLTKTCLTYLRFDEFNNGACVDKESVD